MDLALEKARASLQQHIVNKTYFLQRQIRFLARLGLLASGGREGEEVSESEVFQEALIPHTCTQSYLKCLRLKQNQNLLDENFLMEIQKLSGFAWGGRGYVYVWLVRSPAAALE